MSEPLSDRPTHADVGMAELPTVPGYELEAELGRGGMGVVYAAKQIETGRAVAVKVICDGALAGPRELARFRIEAEAAARMRHPNFVQIFAHRHINIWTFLRQNSKTLVFCTIYLPN